MGSFDVVEQVLAFHVLEHNIVIVGVLKLVDQAHDVRVLAHLEHVDLATLLVYLDRLHVLLVHRLDGHLLTCLFM